MKEVRNVGVMNVVKEFSDTYDDLGNSYKYVVSMNGDGEIEIREMTYDAEFDKWLMGEWITIPIATARVLFPEVAKSLKRGEFDDTY